jgi:hypothetical protein
VAGNICFACTSQHNQPGHSGYTRIDICNDIYRHTNIARGQKKSYTEPEGGLDEKVIAG